MDAIVHTLRGGSMTKTPRGRYPQELKQQAVTMAVEDGFGVTEIARTLSIYLKTEANWVTQYRLTNKSSL